MLGLSRALGLLLTASSLAGAETFINYPGQRGWNNITNGSQPQDYPSQLSVQTEKDGQNAFPYGMQYVYPCGGLPQSTNRTKWPYNGGAISVHPGLGPYNQKSFFWINMGIQAPGELAPPNISLNVVPPFAVVGANETEPFSGQFCLPQVPMPVNATLAPGDNITIQVVQTNEFGANQYNCVDITLVEDDDPDLEPVTYNNCINASVALDLVFTTASLSATSAAAASHPALMSFSSSSSSSAWLLLAALAVSAVSTLS